MLKCEFCNCQKMKKQYEIYSKISSKKIIYYQCPKCHSLKQFPYPDKKEIEEYYKNYYQIKQKINPGYLDKERYNILKNERDKTLKEIKFNKSNIVNKLNVEVGCANGLFLQYLYENGGRNIIGIDISEDLLKAINPSLQTVIKAINGSLKDIEGDSIDNLFLFNVIEHMENIEEIFKEIVRVTKNNSSIIIELPIRGIISYLFGKKWRFLMADEHLNIPSFKGLKTILKKYNLKIIGLTRFGSGFTSGTIHPILKQFFDKIAKFLKIGDRITLHIIKKI